MVDILQLQPMMEKYLYIILNLVKYRVNFIIMKMLKLEMLSSIPTNHYSFHVVMVIKKKKLIF